MPFFFVLENTPRDRLHLHGVVDVNPNEIAKLRVALIKAGGKWKSSRSGERQLHTKGMWKPRGWAKYIFKTLRGLPPAHVKALVGWSRPMTQAGVTLYDQLREFAVGEGAKLAVTRVRFVDSLLQVDDEDFLEDLIEGLRLVVG